MRKIAAAAMGGLLLLTVGCGAGGSNGDAPTSVSEAGTNRVVEAQTQTAEVDEPAVETVKTRSHDDVVRYLNRQGYSTLINDGALNRSIKGSCYAIDGEYPGSKWHRQDRAAWLNVMVDGDTTASEANEFVDNVFAGCIKTGHSVESDVPPMTVNQENAVESAANYLDYTAFSRTGLIEQLKYEGFSNEDAVFGVDAQGADWMAQAVASARNYLDYSSFSRSGLIDQLVYEGFTYDQAEHGVGRTGLR